MLFRSKKDGKGYACISVSENQHLLITRETEKNTKKSKGKLVEEGKTELNFEILAGASIMPFNGIDRNETDKNIRKEIGSYEDFCNTSLSTQHGSLDFINEGSTRRKEILANFLDLQIFEKKYKPANQYANELKSLIKKLQVKDYAKLLGDIHTKHHLAIDALTNANKEVERLKADQADLLEQINKISIDLSKVESPIDIESVRFINGELNSQLFLANTAIDKKTKELKEQEDTIEKINAVIEKLNVEELKTKQEVSRKLLKEIDSILNEKKVKDGSLSIYKKSAELIEMA